MIRPTLLRASLAVTLAGFVASPALVSAAKKGPKKVIAVSDFEVTAQNYTEGGGYWNKEHVGSGMRSMLVESLQKTGKFIVVERGEGLKDIQEEQALKNSGSSRGAGAKSGELMAAQALFRGEITDFTPGQQGGKVRVGGIGPLSNVGVGMKNASIAALVRYFDTSSGEVIDSYQSSEKARSVGFDVSGYAKIPFGTEAYTKTPIGKATNAVIKEITAKIVKGMEKVPFQCKVIKSSGDQVYLNAGEEGGVSVGDTYEVFAMGEALVDPDTGMNLGAEKSKAGIVKVVKVSDKFSIARFDGTPAAEVKAGDVAQESAK